MKLGKNLKIKLKLGNNMLYRNTILHNGKVLELNANFLLKHNKFDKKQPKKDLELTILLQLPYIFFICLISFIAFASLVYFYQQINPNNLIF